MQQVVGIGVRDELRRLRQVDDATIILPVTRVSSSSGSTDRVSPGRQESTVGAGPPWRNAHDKGSNKGSRACAIG